MLQQTTVSVVSPRWIRFIERFPNIEALAAARESEVLAEWSGLGYYSRAKNLRAAARLLSRRQDRFPRSPEEWRLLPGVGSYTAAAVTSIAFGAPVAAVDGNIRRVLSRLFLLGGADGSLERRLVQERADSFLLAEHPGDHNQALMELGATICTPRAPRCPLCPLKGSCAALAAGDPEKYPVRKPTIPSKQIRIAAGVALRRGRLVLVADTFIVPGQLILPIVTVPPGAESAERLRRAWPRLTGRKAKRLVPAGSLRHAVLTRRYTVDVFAVSESPGSKRPGVRLVAPALLAGIVRGALCDKIVAFCAAKASLSE